MALSQKDQFWMQAKAQADARQASADERAGRTETRAERENRIMNSSSSSGGGTFKRGANRSLPSAAGFGFGVMSQEARALNQKNRATGIAEANAATYSGLERLKDNYVAEKLVGRGGLAGRVRMAGGAGSFAKGGIPGMVPGTSAGGGGGGQGGGTVDLSGYFDNLNSVLGGAVDSYQKAWGRLEGTDQLMSQLSQFSGELRGHYDKYDQETSGLRGEALKSAQDELRTRSGVLKNMYEQIDPNSVEQAAKRAGHDVNAQMAQAEQQMVEQARSQGIDVTSPAFMARLARMKTSGALNRGQAQEGARRGAEQDLFNRRGTVAQLSTGAPGATIADALMKGSESRLENIADYETKRTSLGIDQANQFAGLAGSGMDFAGDIYGKTNQAVGNAISAAGSGVNLVNAGKSGGGGMSAVGGMGSNAGWSVGAPSFGANTTQKKGGGMVGASGNRNSMVNKTMYRR